MIPRRTPGEPDAGPSGEAAAQPLRPPEELLEIGFAQARVVIVNEVHDGDRRCVRTREIGRRLLPAADCLGIRHLAMETLSRPEVTAEANRTRRLPEVSRGYLSQPDMRALIEDALDLGWRLWGYEAGLHQQPPDWDPMSQAFTNWREAQQARNLLLVLAELPEETPLLVWCGNHHQLKVTVSGVEAGMTWYPMGWWLVRLGVNPFVIDQAVTVEYGRPHSPPRALRPLVPALEALGGTAGWLLQEAPERWRQSGADAVLLSTRNRME